MSLNDTKKWHGLIKTQKHTRIAIAEMMIIFRYRFPRLKPGFLPLQLHAKLVWILSSLLLNIVPNHILIDAYAAHEVARWPYNIFFPIDLRKPLKCLAHMMRRLAFIRPMTSAIEYFGGITTTMCKWSRSKPIVSIRTPGILLSNFGRTFLRYSVTKGFRIRRLYLVTQTMWYWRR